MDTPYPGTRQVTRPEETMRMRLDEMLADFHRTELVVVGDAMLDWWHEGSAHALCREAPAPAVRVDSTRAAPGGAANTAVNVAALGGRPRFVAAVGDDEAGALLAGELRRRGVATDDLVVVPGWRTTCKRRLVADGQVLARLDESPPAPGLPPGAEGALRDRVAEVLAHASHVLVCDYGLGTLGDDVRQAVAEHRPHLRTVVVDAHDPVRWAGLRPTAVTPDVEECRAMLGHGQGPPGDGASYVERHAPHLLRRSGAESVVATLHEQGALLLRPGQPPVRVGGIPVPRAHTAGAGDTFAAAFTLATAAGHDTESCLAVANLAASVVVADNGTSVCDADMLRARADGHDRVVDVAELRRRLDGHRRAGRRIVFTNGCFDVLHRGHVAYLVQARAQGEVLVVGLNSDGSVRRLKGPDRPVNRCADRAAVLAELRCVDMICVFDEDSPTRLIEEVRPDVYVKGGDYTPEMLPETPLVRRLGGEVRTVDYVQHRSTTELIARIRDGAGTEANP
jgi:D-beta-D-heptose 7-phosphate kinase / D-beta-D-heptose 1-phosphate adenosyltransferase